MKEISTELNFRNLHIVRGLAAFIVVVFHAKFALWVGGNVYVEQRGLHSARDYFLFGIDMLSSCGEQCVIIFFILSAVVIRHSFDKYRNRLRAFYTVRLVRIYIPFLLSLALAVGILFLSIRFINPDIYSTSIRNYNLRLVHAADQFSFQQVLNAVFFTGRGEYAGANFAYWSLGHELVFYLLFPVYYRLQFNGKILAGIISLAAFIITGFTVFYYQVFFIAGLLLYEFFIKRRAAILKPRMAIPVATLLFIAVNLSLKIFSEVWADILTLVLCFVLFDILMFRKNIGKGILTGLADISYTLYLVHLPLLLLFYAVVSRMSGQLQFFDRWPYYSGVVFAVLISIPLYALIERPSIRLLKKIR